MYILIIFPLGQPFVNSDGSLYRYDPANPLPSTAVTNPHSSHHLSLKDTHRGDSTGGYSRVLVLSTGSTTCLLAMVAN